MPAVSQRKGPLPLDKEPRSKSEHPPHKPDPCSLMDNEAFTILRSLSSLVLLERSSNTELSQTESTLIDQVVTDVLKNSLPMCIEVNGTSTTIMDTAPSEDDNVLIERWTLQLEPCIESAAITSINFLIQAVKSFLYFSQITSWSVSNGGQLPFTLTHRIYFPTSVNSCSGFTLSSHPESHGFPLGHIPSLSLFVNVSVSYLPRLDKLPFQLMPPQQLTDNRRDSREQQVLFNARSSPPIVLSATKHTTIKSNQGVAPGVVTTPTVNTTIQSKVRQLSTILSTSNACGGLSQGRVIPFFPPTPSPLSNKALSTLPNGTNGHTEQSGNMAQDTLTTLDHRMNHMSLSKDPALNNREAHGSSRMIISKLGKVSCPSDTDTPLSVKGSQPGRSSCPVWIDNRRPRRVRPPSASSPIPFLLRRASSNGFNSDENDMKEKLKRRSCGIYSKSSSNHPPLPTRSMSLPAVVPNLCLLGTFEESVLNGRIDPLGYVEGFCAEVGASGSFCPQHVTLPVTASFFSLSNDGGPSPYLGHIDLNAGLGKKRGYRIPRKGTFQLTLFNPNKTVVKIFIVTYDHSDMPPNSRTFVRQRTLLGTRTTNDDVILPSLQYLIHLRFLCSKSGHMYLHTDIKLLFAQRAPDTDPDLSKVSLFTVLEGPLNPKYGPLSRELV